MRARHLLVHAMFEKGPFSANIYVPYIFFVRPLLVHRSMDDIKNCKRISLTCLVTELFEIILKEELLLRTSYLIDSRQLGFLDLKSCPTNIISFTDKVVLSINNVHTLSTDVVYFDFSKAFDSVNHDLIIDKFKNYYSIDGRLLKFLKNFEQSVILDDVLYARYICSRDALGLKPVGQARRATIGYLVYKMTLNLPRSRSYQFPKDPFINDLNDGISTDTHKAIYADDTKIWRSIKNK